MTQATESDEFVQPSGEDSSTKAQNSPINVRVITHNIRYATKTPFQGEERWPVRCPRLCSQLAFNSMSIPATFICLQEVLHAQLQDILTSLNGSSCEGDWDYIGVGRTDGIQAGEYSPIIYRKSIWRVGRWGTAWLSETPDRPSKGWDASNIRIVTVAIFIHQETEKSVLLMNTHLDHKGAQSRQESAKYLLEIVQLETDLGHHAAALITGDFNSTPEDGAYEVMTSSDSRMEDIGVEIEQQRRYGNELTFTSFGYIDNFPVRIDFIFSRKGDNLKYLTYAVLANKFDDEVFLSDHRAVVVDLQLLAN